LSVRNPQMTNSCSVENFTFIQQGLRPDS